jgi:hypothetical protein
MHTKFGWKTRRGKNRLEDRRRWNDNIRTDFRETGWNVWTRFIWLTIPTSGGLGSELSGFIRGWEGEDLVSSLATISF